MTRQPDPERLEREVADAHAMLDRLGVDGGRGNASVRERLADLLGQLQRGRPVPSRADVTWALYGRPRSAV